MANGDTAEVISTFQRINEPLGEIFGALLLADDTSIQAVLCMRPPERLLTPGDGASDSGA